MGNLNAPMFKAFSRGYCFPDNNNSVNMDVLLTNSMQREEQHVYN